MQIGTIILAAGESTRMGRPKQLLRIGDSTLIQRGVDTCLEASLGTVVVVLGANAEQIIFSTEFAGITVVVNSEWHAGMHTSIYRGIEEIEMLCPEACGAILMNCDQPWISADTLRGLAELFQSNSSKIVASRYAGCIGTPALFSKILFQRLKQNIDGGAKSIIKEFSDETIPFDFPLGDIDLDTTEEYQQYLKSITPVDS